MRIFFIIGFIFILCVSLSTAGTIGVIGSGYVVATGNPHDLPCTDNAASTVVTNNGIESNWISSVNTSTIYDAGESCFLLDANGDNIKSPSNITFQKIKVTWSQKQVRNPATADEFIFMINDVSTGGMDSNEFVLFRISGGDDFRIKAQGDNDVDFRTKDTTDATGDTNWHDYELTIDATASPWTVTLKQDAATLSWGAWSGNPSTAQFNTLFWIGNGNSEPDAYIKDVIIIDQS